MARNFVRASSQYLGNTSASMPTDFPVCIGCRYKETVGTNNHRFVSFGHTTTTNRWFILFIANTVLDELRWNCNATGVNATAASANVSNDGAWNTAVGWSTSATDHNCVLNADWANRGTVTTSESFPVLNSFDIGRSNQAGVGTQYLDGDISDVFVLLATPTQTEIEAYDDGFCPLDIWYKSDFWGYWPLVRETRPLIGPVLTDNSTTVAGHAPKLIYPRF